MRLYLASQDFGDHVDKLHELVGDNKRALVIFNARDHKSEEDRNDLVSRKRKLVEDEGFEFRELDLREFFGKKEKLVKFLDGYNPGLVFAFGGNYFILRRAFRESGFDEILLRDLDEDKYVYGGSSAGSMIVSPDLNYYDDQDPKVVPEGYSKEVVWEGLGLLEEYISPHQDQEWYRDFFERRLERFKRDGKPLIALKDSDVCMVDRDKKEILRS